MELLTRITWQDWLQVGLCGLLGFSAVGTLLARERYGRFHIAMPIGVLVGGCIGVIVGWLIGTIIGGALRGFQSADMNHWTWSISTVASWIGMWAVGFVSPILAGKDAFRCKHPNVEVFDDFSWNSDLFAGAEVIVGIPMKDAAYHCKDCGARWITRDERTFN